MLELTFEDIDIMLELTFEDIDIMLELTFEDIDIMLELTFEDIIGIYVSVVYIRPSLKPINNRESSRFSNKDFYMES